MPVPILLTGFARVASVFGRIGGAGANLIKPVTQFVGRAAGWLRNNPVAATFIAVPFIGPLFAGALDALEGHARKSGEQAFFALLAGGVGLSVLAYFGYRIYKHVR